MASEKFNVFAIDDEPINLLLLENILSHLYHVYTFTKYNELKKLSDQILPDIILLDILMPDSDGYQILTEIKSNHRLNHIPVIFLTSKTEELDEAKGISLGAIDYITKPYSPDILKVRISTHIQVKEMQDKLRKQNENLLLEVENRVNDFVLIQDTTLGVLAHIVEKRDMETGNHILRTQNYVNIIAQKLSKMDKYNGVLTPTDITNISKASMLHDIGKVAVPDSILSKNGKLSEDEWITMKNHCLYGKQAIDQAIKLLNVNFPNGSARKSEVIKFFQVAKDIAYSHHEKWNGMGYPEGLSKQAIPLSARIMAVADVFDALMSNRPYKKAWSYEDAIQQLIIDKGTHFDPDVIDAFMSEQDSIKELLVRFSDSV